MDTRGRHQKLINRCLPPETPKVRDNIELAVRAVITLHHQYATGYPDKIKPIEGTILAFVPGKPEILEIIELLKSAMRRGFTARLYPYGFHSDTPAQDRVFLFKGGRDPNIPRRDELRSLATGAGYKKYALTKEAVNSGAAAPADPSLLPSREVIIATTAAETAVTCDKCWLCIDTCMVNQMMYNASLRAKVQQTVPCSQAVSQQRGGRAGRDSPGMCLRLVTQLEWNNMPARDPPQPHMDDQTSLYLRLASTEAESAVRDMLLDTIGTTKELRADTQQIVFQMIWWTLTVTLHQGEPLSPT